MNQLSPSFSFEDLSLSPQVARAIKDMEYTEATHIQALAIPPLLQGADIIGRSSTGTGKTAAFGIPAVECIDSELKRAQVLVLSPTRELAMQIAKEMQKYAKYKEGVSVAAVYGGASMSDQIRALRRANIVIGTPGRLMDHLRRHTLKMENLKMVILDEADEMLSMGFIEDIQSILAQAPEERQTVLFSATMPPPVLKISKEFLREPQVVDVMTEEDAQADIEQVYYYVPQQRKIDALRLLLAHNTSRRSIVFCNTKSMVDELAELLHSQGILAVGLHGDMTQAVRTQVMQNFRNGKITTLIATDVAARGIDVNDVDAVINFDLPQSFEYYVHRIGRTGRAGKKGLSQTLICNGRQASILRELMKFTGTPILEHDLPTPADLAEKELVRLADEIQPLLQIAPSKEARLLVKLLSEESASEDDKEICLALAQYLVAQSSSITALSSFGAIKGANRPAPNQEPRAMVTINASIGRNTRVTPNHFIGALVEALDISAQSIGKIDIKEETSSITLREDSAMAVLEYTKSIRILGEKVKFTLKKSKRSEGKRSNSRKDFGDKKDKKFKDFKKGKKNKDKW